MLFYNIRGKSIEKIMNKIQAKIYLEELFEFKQWKANYICNFSVYYNYIYVAMPKVACTSILRTLQSAEVRGDASRLPLDVHDREQSPLPKPSDDIGTFVTMMASPETFRFCFVRNPFTRVLSCYLDKFIQDEKEREWLAPTLGFDPAHPPLFREFLTRVSEQPEQRRDLHWASQAHILRPDRIGYSFIGRFEFFRQHMEHVCHRVGITRYADFSATSHATQAASKIADYFGQTEIELVRAIYEADFECFGYDRTLPL